MVNLLRRFGLEPTQNGRLTPAEERGLSMLWRMRLAVLIVDVLALVSIPLAAWYVAGVVRAEADHTRRLVMERTK